MILMEIAFHLQIVYNRSYPHNIIALNIIDTSEDGYVSHETSRL